MAGDKAVHPMQQHRNLEMGFLRGRWRSGSRVKEDIIFSDQNGTEKRKKEDTLWCGLINFLTFSWISVDGGEGWSCRGDAGRGSRFWWWVLVNVMVAGNRWEMVEVAVDRGWRQWWGMVAEQGLGLRWGIKSHILLFFLFHCIFNCLYFLFFFCKLTYYCRFRTG